MYGWTLSSLSIISPWVIHDAMFCIGHVWLPMPKAFELWIASKPLNTNVFALALNLGWARVNGHCSQTRLTNQSVFGILYWHISPGKDWSDNPAFIPGLNRDWHWWETNVQPCAHGIRLYQQDKTCQYKYTLIHVYFTFAGWSSWGFEEREWRGERQHPHFNRK